MSKRDEERTKLSANFLNGVAIACVSLGGLGPLISYLYGLSPIVTDVGPITLMTGVLIWSSAGFVLHLMARSVLNALD